MAEIMKIIRIHVRKFRIAFDGAIFSRDEIQSGQFRNALVKDFKICADNDDDSSMLRPFVDMR